MTGRSAGRCVATIGVFDGVHAGHQALVGRAREVAHRLGLPLVAVTFDPDPMSVLVSSDAVPALMPVERRVELLLGSGADEVVVLAFDEELQLTTAEGFVEGILVDRLHVAAVVIGPDFLFGHRAAGNVEMLREAGARLGFAVEVADMVGDGSDRWSATRIRACVAKGDVRQAAAGLTRWYGLEGTVVHGEHRGRELGFPTANVEWTGHRAVPADGVYAGFLACGEATWPAAISVGTNPQFAGRQRTVEAYAIDEAGLDLYGQAVRVDFVERLRGQETFTSVDALVEQMAADVARARSVTAAAGPA